MMRRLFGLILLAVLLCGCTAEPVETVTETTGTAATEPTEPAGIYVPGSEAEKQTAGALRVYLPEISDSYAIETAGSDLLLFSGTETTTLTRLSGDNLFTIASAQLDCLIYPEDPSFQISDKGITYYDGQARAVIFLDHDLKEVSRLDVPEKMTGTPVLSSNRTKLFYCTADAVRVLDLETGLDKLLKQIAYPEQSVQGILFGDTVLQCVISDTEAYTIFLSTETGALLQEAQEALTLTAGNDMYYSMMPEGIMQALIYGIPGEEPQMIIPEDAFGLVWYLEARSTLVTASVETSATDLDYYDLATGLRTSSVEIPGETVLWYVAENAEDETVYLMGMDTTSEQVLIYRWEVQSTAVSDETVYSGPWYTLENPDTEGLSGCEAYAQRLTEQYGVEIRIGAHASEVQPWDYEMATEYQVPVIQRELQTLDALLAQFPEGFFAALGDTKISLVRSVNGSAESGSLAAANGIQFWVGDTAYVALTAGEMLEKTFYHELFHVIESYVFSECTAYYDWEELNPEGFAYDLDYTTNQNREEDEYLQDETRAFIDTYSMSYPKEDRARIFEYASTAGNESCFRSETMQAKLKTLCQGIREAFDLREYPNPFVWEQYLNEPLTPAE